MKFSAYVPAAVREKIAHYLEGERDGDIPGYIDLLASAKSELAKIDLAIEARIRRDEADYLPSLNKQRAEATKHRDSLSSSVECLQRLAHDPRMRGAYALLVHEFVHDHQWSDFIFCAWVAQTDYGPYREKLKRAGALKEEIADMAEKLAKLLVQHPRTGMYPPDEFFSVAELLRRTDNHDMRDHNLASWRMLRGRLLGDPPRSAEVSGESPKPEATPELNSAPTIVVRYFVEPGEEVTTDSEESARAMLRYVWQISPDLPALLETVARAARAFTPIESGMVGAAIGSRKRNAKTEYLRGFAERLTHHGMKLTPVVKRAMAIVANVAVNLPDVDVSHDDVRKALANLGGDSPEDSKEK